MMKVYKSCGNCAHYHVKKDDADFGACSDAKDRELTVYYDSTCSHFRAKQGNGKNGKEVGVKLEKKKHPGCK